MVDNYLLKLARQALDTYVKHGEIITSPAHIQWPQRACFVVLLDKPGRSTRSMYGNALPRHPHVGEEIIANLIEAVKRSNRAIRPLDLKNMYISLAILGHMERITTKQHLDPQRYGLYMHSDQGKSALILSQRTGIESPDDQIATAYRESGIRADQEVARMYRFAVEYYEEKTNHRIR